MWRVRRARGGRAFTLAPPLRRIGRRSDGGQHEVSVVVEAEARVVRDLPRVPVEIAERAGVPAVERHRRLARDLRAVTTRLLEQVLHFLPRAHVMRERDSAPT